MIVDRLSCPISIESGKISNEWGIKSSQHSVAFTIHVTVTFNHPLECSRTAILDCFTVTVCHSSPCRHCLLGNCHSWLFHCDRVSFIPMQTLFTGQLPFLTISQWPCVIHPHANIVYWATAILDYFIVTVCHSSLYRHCLLGNCHSWLFHSDRVPFIPIQALFTGQLPFLTILHWSCAIHLLQSLFTRELPFWTVLQSLAVLFGQHSQIIHRIHSPFHVGAIV